MNLRYALTALPLLLAACTAPEPIPEPAPYTPPPSPQYTPPPVPAPAPAPAPMPEPVQVGENSPAPAMYVAPQPIAAPQSMEEAALSRLSASAPALNDEPPAPKKSAPGRRAETQPAGPTARTVDGALLRDRPVRNVYNPEHLTSNTLVRLITPVKNNDGEWWFVTITGVGGGWMQLGELTAFSR